MLNERTTLTFNIKHSTFNIPRHHPTCSFSPLDRCILDNSSCSCCCTDRKSASTFASCFCLSFGAASVFWGCGCGEGPDCGCFDPDELRCTMLLRASAISRLRFAAA